MDKPVRTTRKRKPIVDDDPIEHCSPNKKTKRLAKNKEKVPKKKTEKVAELKKKDNKVCSQPKKTTTAKAPKKNLNENTTNETTDNVFISTCMWDEAEMLSHVERIPLSLAQNFVSLLTEGCTLPFIARYRKTLVDHIMPER